MKKIVDLVSGFSCILNFEEWSTIFVGVLGIWLIVFVLVLFGLFWELTGAHVEKTINSVDLGSLFIYSVIYGDWFCWINGINTNADKNSTREIKNCEVN